MKHSAITRFGLMTMLLVGAFASASVLAAPPRGHESGPRQQIQSSHKQAPHKQPVYKHPSRNAAPHRAPAPMHRFRDEDRRAIHDYYRRAYARGGCPPGLVRRGAFCAPRHEARSWTRGRALARDVIYYDVPPTLLVKLPAPPARHRYVRVAGDILLIAIGTGLVVDAIQDIF
ncbi:MAG: RcnB family protein [Candidatus Accumulibacter sp.]|jgi:Ni/Co efflux regulator RcnB|nr:RcnB family protein [Accumulibacter sp.]